MSKSGSQASLYLNEIHHSCWVTIFNIRSAIGPWSDGICDDVMDRDVHKHSSRLKINTEKCIFLSGKIKLNHYSFCCSCHAKTNWIWQNWILHDFINIKMTLAKKVYHMSSFEDPVKGKVLISLIESSSLALSLRVFQCRPFHLAEVLESIPFQLFHPQLLTCS